MPGTNQKPTKFSFLTGGIQLAEGKNTSVVTITKLGNFFDPRYGNFEITQDHFNGFIKNFNEKTYGQDLPIDFAHFDSEGAAGWIKRVFQEGKRLRAEVEWTPAGVEAIKNKKYRYMSAEFVDDFIDNEQGLSHGPLMMGAALTIRPAIKGMDPVSLAEEAGAGGPIYIHPDLIRQLQEEEKRDMDKFIKMLSEALSKIKGLSKDSVDSIIRSYTYGMDMSKLSDEEMQMHTNRMTALAEAMVPAPASAAATAVTEGAPKTLSEADVTRLVGEGVARFLAERQHAEKQLADKKAANVKLLSDTITAAQGIPDDVKKSLSEGLSPSITGDMPEGAVKALAETAVRQAESLAAQTKLAALGFTGNIRVLETESEGKIKQLSDKLEEGFGFKKLSDAQKFPQMGKATEAAKTFSEKVLERFDQIHGRRLAEEAKILLDGGSIGDTSLPISVQRTVIRFALQDLVALNFVDSGVAVDMSAPSLMIPYIARKGTIKPSDIRRYEGQTINNANLQQLSELAYIGPKKLGIKLSNEQMLFTKLSQLDYDAAGDGVANMIRVVKELEDGFLFNEIANSCDEYGAVAVANENIAAAFDGAKTKFPLAHFPVVRARSVYDLQGNQIGSTTNPITVTYDGAVRAEWAEGVAAGTYYVLDYNLGMINIVDQTGAAIAPANGKACTVSYSYSTNVLAVDATIPNGQTYEQNLNQLLYAFGRRKAMLSQDRYVHPNFSIMSYTLNQTITEAELFRASQVSPGVGALVNNDGNLQMVKGVPCFGTNAPGLNMGDQRIFIGERGVTKYRVAKPFTMATPFVEFKDPTTGSFTGEKHAYGEEYSCEHTPSLLKLRLTSILYYTAADRTAA